MEIVYAIQMSNLGLNIFHAFDQSPYKCYSPAIISIAFIFTFSFVEAAGVSRIFGKGATLDFKWRVGGHNKITLEMQCSSRLDLVF